MFKTRIISFVLVVVMLFSFSTIAFAEIIDVEASVLNETKFLVRDYGDTKTVYIDVDIEDYPELASINVINSVAKQLYTKQFDYAEDSYALMSRNHIAGELALHIFLFRVLYMLGAGSEDSILHKYYVEVKNATLNLDEERISTSLIETVGVMVTWFGFNLDSDLGIDMDNLGGDLMPDADISMGDLIA